METKASDLAVSAVPDGGLGALLRPKWGAMNPVPAIVAALNGAHQLRCNRHVTDTDATCCRFRVLTMMATSSAPMPPIWQRPLTWVKRAAVQKFGDRTARLAAAAALVVLLVSTSSGCCCTRMSDRVSFSGSHQPTVDDSYQ